MFRLSRVLRLGSLSVYDVDLQAAEYRSLGVAPTGGSHA